MAWEIDYGQQRRGNAFRPGVVLRTSSMRKAASLAELPTDARACVGYAHANALWHWRRTRRASSGPIAGSGTHILVPSNQHTIARMRSDCGREWPLCRATWRA
ncbi:hypothetical protein C7S18_04790 [Ahniella affigens]|uniref:Uncharacterized protein n=1 Tax=Ahniella affigens TaxID=2021234 RepID=A0A2P1PNZ1_9GAMM|nr:hypothetical protein C7S18_04790 [Ahniella affigens]